MQELYPKAKQAELDNAYDDGKEQGHDEGWCEGFDEGWAACIEDLKTNSCLVEDWREILAATGTVVETAKEAAHD